jgi:2'-5' RNA ligase
LLFTLGLILKRDYQKNMRSPLSYSYWLLPEEPINTYLSNIIADISQKWRAPTFSPHITLLGGLDEKRETMSKSLYAFASTLRPFNVSLGNIAWGEGFFESFYFNVLHSVELVRARAIAMDALGLKDMKEFHPHCSLFYGERSEKEKHDMAASIDLPANLNFKVNEIYLAHNNEIELEWKILESCKLNNK